MSDSISRKIHVFVRDAWGVIIQRLLNNRELSHKIIHHYLQTKSNNDFDMCYDLKIKQPVLSIFVNGII